MDNHSEINFMESRCKAMADQIITLHNKTQRRKCLICWKSNLQLTMGNFIPWKTPDHSSLSLLNHILKDNLSQIDNNNKMPEDRLQESQCCMYMYICSHCKGMAQVKAIQGTIQLNRLRNNLGN